jgi:spore coat polysaccharide biosynthesis protein SpsF (cytidylyltransferase family)
VSIIEGPEFDVLERYAIAVRAQKPDAIVRLTGDCPLIQSYVIDGIVKIAQRNEYDYLSNVDERCRTAIDGLDVEYISAKALLWAAEVATIEHDRDHVTTKIRREPPSWARLGTVITHLDLSGMKLSVDTQEDLDRVNEAFRNGANKYQAALKIYGHGAVHRL